MESIHLPPPPSSPPPLLAVLLIVIIAVFIIPSPPFAPLITTDLAPTAVANNTPLLLTTPTPPVASIPPARPILLLFLLPSMPTSSGHGTAQQPPRKTEPAAHPPGHLPRQDPRDVPHDALDVLGIRPRDAPRPADLRAPGPWATVRKVAPPLRPPPPVPEAAVDRPALRVEAVGEDLDVVARRRRAVSVGFRCGRPAGGGVRVAAALGEAARLRDDCAIAEAGVLPLLVVGPGVVYVLAGAGCAVAEEGLGGLRGERDPLYVGW